MKEKYYQEIKNVIFNKPATIVILKDGRKGVAMLLEGDTWNKETGFWCAYAKALRAEIHVVPCGNTHCPHYESSEISCCELKYSKDMPKCKDYYK